MIFKDNIHVVQTDIRIHWCSWSDMPLDVTPPQKKTQKPNQKKKPQPKPKPKIPKKPANKLKTVIYCVRHHL